MTDWICFAGDTGTKLLGAPELPQDCNTKFGPKVASLTHDLLMHWKCADSIKAMVFDTTSANTGHISAACISIQEKLGRQLLWCPCRHHIGEVILSRVWKSLNIEPSNSPQVSIFSRLRSSFHLISQSKPFCQFEKNNESIEEVVEFCQRMLQQDHCRDDYKELLQLVLLYLDGQSSTNFKIHPPGAIHNARWMSKVITSLKLLLLETHINSELPKDEIFNTKEQRNKIHQFIQFVIFSYLQFWYTASNTTDAPNNDLMFWKRIYAAKDKVIKNAALKALQNHTWYLTEELILLSLFSDHVSKEDKQDILDHLSSAIDHLRRILFRLVMVQDMANQFYPKLSKIPN